MLGIRKFIFIFSRMQLHFTVQAWANRYPKINSIHTCRNFFDLFIRQWHWGGTNEDKCIIQKERDSWNIDIVVACFFRMFICGCLVIFYKKKSIYILTVYIMITVRKLWLAFKWMEKLCFTTFIYLSYKLPFKMFMVGKTFLDQ